MRASLRQSILSLVPERRVRPLIVAGLVILGLTGHPSPASAQFWKQLGFGAMVGINEPTDADVEGGLEIGGAGGMAPEDGWGFDASLGWFEADLRDGRGASARRIGDVNVRPLLGGIGYTWLQGKVATTASLTAGVSINSVSLDDALATTSAGPSAYALEVSNSFAFRPALEVEYFIARKLAVRGSTSYLFTRPEITFSTPDGRITDRWNASSFTVLAGIVVYPFR